MLSLVFQTAIVDNEFSPNALEKLASMSLNESQNFQAGRETVSYDAESRSSPAGAKRQILSASFSKNAGFLANRRSAQANNRIPLFRVPL
jgi:hypothetical protein